MANPKVLTIGLSGSSSAGKTSLCALLSLILPEALSQSSTKLLFLHCDAFGKDFPLLPRRPNGMLDAESRESFHFDKIKACIDKLRATGEQPTKQDGYDSYDFIEKDLEVARKKLQPKFVALMKDTVMRAKIDWNCFNAVAVIDHLLLYHDAEIRAKLDIMLLLRTSKAEARMRRFGRYGQNAVADDSEDFWKTMPYFDAMVWPNYVKEHSFMFPEDDVESEVDPLKTKMFFGVLPAPKIDMGFEESMMWAVGALLHEVEDLSRS